MLYTVVANLGFISIICDVPESEIFSAV